MKTLLAKTLIFLLAGTLSTQVWGQQPYQISTEGLKLEVHGTSTLHDWEMVSDVATGTAQFAVQGTAFTLSRLLVEMPSESIKSGTSSMDDNAYEALKTEKFPKIRLVIKEAEGTLNQEGKLVGTLTIAGVSKDITFTTTVTQVGSDIRTTGKAAFKLTDFAIDPPTAVFGTIKTGNEVTLHIEALFKEKK
ncbi:YceI family protein [Cytophagales bacterium LB-30]|uniref:YceI family protein n=1 Tax=Shiella aurantiaca TaxID=3058365 RepID=A0ABT8F300_9BACT|nr:YceI family protein [Shiella aurantiaca]MDN4164795.1 YceI family protein [Shiella aurantiaca]